MVEDKEALQKNGTWELVLLLEGKGPTLLMMRERMTYRIARECILSYSCLMDRLKDIKLVLLQRDSPIN